MPRPRGLLCCTRCCRGGSQGPTPWAFLNNPHERGAASVEPTCWPKNKDLMAPCQPVKSFKWGSVGGKCKYIKWLFGGLLCVQACAADPGVMAGTRPAGQSLADSSDPDLITMAEIAVSSQPAAKRPAQFAVPYPRRPFRSPAPGAPKPAPTAVRGFEFDSEGSEPITLDELRTAPVPRTAQNTRALQQASSSTQHNPKQPAVRPARSDQSSAPSRRRGPDPRSWRPLMTSQQLATAARALCSSQQPLAQLCGMSNSPLLACNAVGSNFRAMAAHMPEDSLHGCCLRMAMSVEDGRQNAAMSWAAAGMSAGSGSRMPASMEVLMPLCWAVSAVCDMTIASCAANVATTSMSGDQIATLSDGLMLAGGSHDQGSAHTAGVTLTPKLRVKASPLGRCQLQSDDPAFLVAAERLLISPLVGFDGSPGSIRTRWVVDLMAVSMHLPGVSSLTVDQVRAIAHRACQRLRTAAAGLDLGHVAVERTEILTDAFIGLVVVSGYRSSIDTRGLVGSLPSSSAVISSALARFMRECALAELGSEQAMRACADWADMAIACVGAESLGTRVGDAKLATFRR